MRIAFVMISVTVLAAMLVHLRREELAVRHQMHQTQARHAELRREIWDRQVRLGYLTTPRAIRQRAEALALDLVPNTPDRYALIPETTDGGGLE